MNESSPFAGEDSEPIKHHYVSAFHLGEFTHDGTRYGDLMVFDKKRRKTWSSTAHSSALEKDFYKVECDGLDPYAIERALATFENECSRTFKQIVKTGKFPSDDDEVSQIVSYVALAIARVPQIRNRIVQLTSGSFKAVIGDHTSGDDEDSQIRRFLLSDDYVPSDEDIQEVKRSLSSDDYAICYDRTWQVKIMLEGQQYIFPKLTARNWGFWKCESDTPNLICSDCPVAFIPSSGGPPSPEPWASPDLTLVMPMTPRLALASRLDELGNATVVIDSNTAGLVNRIIADQSAQIYNATEAWSWMMNDGRLGNWQDYLDQSAGD